MKFRSYAVVPSQGPTPEHRLWKQVYPSRNCMRGAENLVVLLQGQMLTFLVYTVYTVGKCRLFLRKTNLNLFSNMSNSMSGKLKSPGYFWPEQFSEEKLFIANFSLRKTLLIFLLHIYTYMYIYTYRYILLTDL